MVVGLNHNIRYRGEVFHIQTEDSGLANPQITTLLFIGGTIISSKKTSYADIVKIENVEKVVEELMKEQHKDMLRRLKAGEFDARIISMRTPQAPAPPKPIEPPQFTETAPKTEPSTVKPSLHEQSMDDIILSYFASEDKE
ncbi:MAG: hypothetical protein HYS23_13880 [Geobacter sp.]|nr:hypothetical protein [Geobacter sp.]